MPITPFHLIAATPIKAIAPDKFSWSVFCLTNIVIDLEPITYFLVTLEPRHMYLHSIIGATAIAILCASFGKKLCELAIQIWNDEIRDQPETRWFSSETKISKTAAWSGALIGAWSHLILDSFMHEDIKPLSPFTSANFLLGTIDIGWLHSMCLIAGILGGLVLLIRRA